MADVFISYSRRQKDFVLALHEALIKISRDTWVDWEDIPPTAEWLAEIYSAIESADNFLFVISPESVISEMCNKELAHAIEHKKRLIPIMRREVDSKTVPDALAKLQYVFCREGDDFNSGFQELIKAIDTDLVWKRAHTRLEVRAIEWENKKRDNGFLVHGMDLQDARQWLARADTGKEPQPTDLQKQYIQASEEWDAQERQRLQDLYTKALTRQLTAQAELTRQSPRLVQRSVLLAVEAMRRQPSPEAYQALRRGLQLLPRPLKYLQQRSSVCAITFSPKGGWFAAASQDGNIQIWDTQTRVIVGEVKHDARVNALAFSPDEKWLATASDDKTVRVWETATRRLIASLSHDEPVTVVEFNPDGTYLLTATCFRGHPGAARLSSVSDWQETRSMNKVASAKFDISGELVACTQTNHIVIFETTTGKAISDLPHPQTVLTMDFHPREPLLAALTFDEGLWLWQQVKKDQEVSIVPIRLSDSISRTSPILFSPDGRWLAAAGNDHSIRVWEAATKREIARMQHKGLELDLRFDPSGQFLASVSSEDHSICVWNASTGQTVACIEQNQATAVCFSPDGRWLASASDRDAAWIWEPPTEAGVVWTAVVGLGHALKFSPDGRWLAWTGTRIAQDGKIVVNETLGMLKVLDAATGREAWSFQHEAQIKAVAFSPDGQWIATACNDTFRAWEVTTGREEPAMRQEAQAWLNEVLRNTQEHPKAIVSSDGHLLATKSGGSTEGQPRMEAIQVREVATGRIISELRFEGEAMALAFSADTRWLASGHVDGSIRLWETLKGVETARFEHHIEPVTALAFSPHGNWLASGGYDCSVRMWLARPDDLVEQACSRLTRNLTKDEWEQYLGDEPYGATYPAL